jgi:hypothetical protein
MRKNSITQIQVADRGNCNFYTSEITTHDTYHTRAVKCVIMTFILNLTICSDSIIIQYNNYELIKCFITYFDPIQRYRMKQ